MHMYINQQNQQITPPPRHPSEHTHPSAFCRGGRRARIRSIHSSYADLISWMLTSLQTQRCSGRWTSLDILHTLNKTWVCAPGACGSYVKRGLTLSTLQPRTQTVLGDTARMDAHPPFDQQPCLRGWGRMCMPVCALSKLVARSFLPVPAC